MIGSELVGPIKLPGWVLYYDGQMICSYVIIKLSKSASVELVSLKDDCRWRIETFFLRNLAKV